LEPCSSISRFSSPPAPARSAGGRGRCRSLLRLQSVRDFFRCDGTRQLKCRGRGTRGSRPGWPGWTRRAARGVAQARRRPTQAAGGSQHSTLEVGEAAPGRGSRGRASCCRRWPGDRPPAVGSPRARGAPTGRPRPAVSGTGRRRRDHQWAQQRASLPRRRRRRSPLQILAGLALSRASDRARNGVPLSGLTKGGDHGVHTARAALWQGALAPLVSAETIEYHYGKHHQTYVTNLNNLTAGTDWERRSLEEIVRGAEGPSSTTGLRSGTTLLLARPAPQGGGSPAARCGGAGRRFGSFESFKEQLTKAAVGHFGSAGLAGARQGRQAGRREHANAGCPLRGRQDLRC